MLCSFFSGCHLFLPIFDVSYDSYDGLMERSPWTFDAILAVAGKIKSGNNPPAPSFYKALEEAQGIARSSLFGPVVRKEAVQGIFSVNFLWGRCSQGVYRDATPRRVEHEQLAAKRSWDAHGSRFGLASRSRKTCRYQQQTQRGRGARSRSLFTYLVVRLLV
jgi:hypothetical protein